jgi:hypothetical protein
MSDDATVAEAAARLLNDGSDFRGKTDFEIKEIAVREMLNVADDCSPAYVDGAFDALCDGDPRFAQARRAERKRRLAALAAAPVGRIPN